MSTHAAVIDKGTYLSRRESYPEAIPFLEEAIEVRPDRDDIVGSLIEAYEKSGRESVSRKLS